MDISSITNIQSYSANISNTNDIQPATIQEEPVANNQEIEEPEEDIESTETEKDAPRGVIRNLINGHFKGVADVRLRINFNDEITALEQAELAKVADSGLSTLSETISNEINTVLGSEEIDEEASLLIASALETFNNEITQIKTNISESGNLLSEIRTSFDNFVLSVNPVTEEPVETEPPATDEIPLAVIEETEEIPVPETDGLTGEIPLEETSQFSMEQFLADLTATFEAEMELLEATLANTRVLPEISEPSGNGKAFDKFLTIYDEIKGNINADSQNSDIDVTT